MKLILSIFIFLALSLFSHFSFAKQNNALTQDNKSNTEVNQQDNNILAVLVVLNKNEIKAAKEALKHTKNGHVTTFALLMQKDHGNNLKETLKIAHDINISIKPTASSNELKEKGKKELNNLSSLKGNEFDKAYIDAMVKGHQNALEQVTQFQSQTNNEELKNHLNQTKTAVEKHLNIAKEVQNKLNA